MCCREDYLGDQQKWPVFGKQETMAGFPTISIEGLIPGMNRRGLVPIRRIELRQSCYGEQ